MTIAVASGKGGTGKTTVSVALARSCASPVTLLDCDVEEPNAALFLGGGIGATGGAAAGETRESPVTVPVPVIDEAACTACGACAKVCEFKAIVHIGSTVMIFPELCHSCGGCALACPSGAIREEASPIGTLTESSTEGINLVQGLLSIGHAMSPPVIRAVKRRGRELASPLTIIDSPPGTSCPMNTAVSGADGVVLVTEPTPFGLHDLTLAVKGMRKTGMPFGVVINRSDSGDNRVEAWCEREGIKVFLKIPEDRRIAEGYSSGIPLTDSVPEYRPVFVRLLSDLQQEFAKAEA